MTELTLETINEAGARSPFRLAHVGAWRVYQSWRLSTDGSAIVWSRVEILVPGTCLSIDEGEDAANALLALVNLGRVWAESEGQPIPEQMARIAAEEARDARSAWIAREREEAMEAAKR